MTDIEAPAAFQHCPVCGASTVCRLVDDWRDGRPIPIVGCGNPWHYDNGPEATPETPSLDAVRRRGLSSLTLTELRDRAEASGIRWWDDSWRKSDFIDTLAARLAVKPDDAP